MFLFPISTDAPVYYWPFATVGLIVVNVLMFIGIALGTIPNGETLILWYGDGLHPLQWLTSNFIHGGLDHLIGNMLFLWVFGLVVEGKLGWWKFLACYLGIGIVQSMFEQIVMLGYTGEPNGSCGASAAIFGLMMMAAIWAPKNEITFFYMFAVRMGTFDVSIAVLAVFYTVMEMSFAILLGGNAASSLLHLSGMALGLPLGIALLKLDVVDCEGWDAFHVWSGNYGSFREEPKPEPVKASVEPPEVRQRHDDTKLGDAKAQLREYLKNNNVAAALKLREKMKGIGGGLVLDRSELLTIIKVLHVAGRWRDSAPLMAEAIERFPENADAVRVKLAQICVVELNRPGKALDLLAEVDTARLPEPQVTLAKKITVKAQAMQAEGVFELDDNAW